MNKSQIGNVLPTTDLNGVTLMEVDILHLYIAELLFVLFGYKNNAILMIFVWCCGMRYQNNECN